MSEYSRMDRRKAIKKTKSERDALLEQLIGKADDADDNSRFDDSGYSDASQGSDGSGSGRSDGAGYAGTNAAGSASDGRYASASSGTAAGSASSAGTSSAGSSGFSGAAGPGATPGGGSGSGSGGGRPPRRPGSSGQPPAPKRKSKAGALKYILILLVIGALSYGGLQVYYFVSEPLNVAEDQDNNDTDNDEIIPIEEDEFAKDRINILILGIDNVNDGPDRSDTIILASLFPEEKQVKMLSLPRDTRLMIPGHGNDKLNHAYVYGGVNLVRRSVEEFTRMPIDYYIETNFQGFINAIDILGGVTMNVEKRMYYPDEDIDLQPGLQTLNGFDSLAYVRYRSDGLGDIGRIGRQQRFLKVLAENNIKTSNILKIPELVNELAEHVKTDLSILKMISIGNTFSKMDPSHIEAYQVPGFSGMQNEVSYWIPDLNATKRIVDSMRRPTAIEAPEEAAESQAGDAAAAEGAESTGS